MFITIEWWEWTGKTTQIQKIKQYFENKNYKIFITREPGGNWSVVAEKIRQIIKDPANKSMIPKTELFLFLAARAQHVEEIILPKLKKGYILISDRFFWSTLAYQHYARELFEYDFVKNLNEIATEWLIPDFTLYLDIDPQTGLNRRGSDINCRLDQEKIEFHEKVRKGFWDIARKEKNWHIIDANSDIETVFGKIKSLLEKHI